MKVLSVLASPRKHGNTAELLNSFVHGISTNESIEIESIFLQNKRILPCVGCSSCQETLEPKCVLNDDMKYIYKSILDSDILILATPIYWWNISGQLKIFMDRIYALMQNENNENLKGKKVILIMTYGGEEPNTGATMIINSFKEIADFTGMKLCRVLGVSSGKISVKENAPVLKKAYEAGRNILSL